MKPYRQLDAAYQQLRHRHARRPIPGLGDLDLIVDTIRSDTPDSTDSDEALRDLLRAGRTAPEANTVALHALAPDLAYRISRTATVEYHQEALTELAFVILDSDLAGARLAHRLVNRTHSRVWRSARIDRVRGGTNPVEILPREPDRLVLIQELLEVAVNDDTVADVATARVSLQRFQAAVDDAVARGVVPDQVWTAYRKSRLRSAGIAESVRTTSQERVLAHRAARRLNPYIDAHLAVHAA